MQPEKKKRNRTKVVNRSTILVLHSMGYKQAWIADKLKIHTTTVGKIIRECGYEPLGHNKTLTEYILDSLSPDQRSMLSTIVNPSYTIIDYVSYLVKTDINKRRGIPDDE